MNHPVSGCLPVAGLRMRLVAAIRSGILIKTLARDWQPPRNGFLRIEKSVSR
jgi:hypothetical protein